MQKLACFALIALFAAACGGTTFTGANATKEIGSGSGGKTGASGPSGGGTTGGVQVDPATTDVGTATPTVPPPPKVSPAAPTAVPEPDTPAGSGPTPVDPQGLPGGNEGEDIVPIETTTPEASVHWHWPCPSAQSPAPAPASATDFVVTGTKEIDLAGASEAPLTFSGSLCPVASAQRDIVFVVDVSGSMGPHDENGQNKPGNDPEINNSCGRLQAVNAILADLPQDGTARVSLLTFSSSVKKKSSDFFQSGAEMIEDIRDHSGDGFRGVVCASDGSTNYEDALEGAEQLLKDKGRKTANKEIYFISDGKPDPTNKNGIAAAADLRDDGAVIAAIMLIGDETIMRDSIASKDSTGKPLFTKVSDAAALADALVAIAANKLVGAVLKFRAVGAATWNETDLMALLKGLDFSVDAGEVGSTAYPRGIEAKIDSWDARNVHAETSGVLTFR